MPTDHILQHPVDSTTDQPTLEVESDPTFPLHVFPPLVQQFLTASAASAHAPIDMLAAAFLAITGSVIGFNARFQVGNDGNGWIERPVLWIAIVAPTGTGKTPALSAVRQPLEPLQLRAWQEWLNKHRIWHKQYAYWGNHKTTIFRPYEPRIERYYTTDTSIDSLLRDLEWSSGICLIRDELIGLVNGLQRGNARQHFLSLWAHRPIILSARDPDGIMIERPVVGIVGCLPNRLYHKLRAPDHDGLVERFLPILATPRHEYWTETSSEMDTGNLTRAITDLFIKLRTTPPDDDDVCDGVLVTRHPDAIPVWAAWFDDNVDRIAAANANLQGFYLKLPGHVARIALILHCLWNPDNVATPLTAETMRRAIELGEVFRTHIHRSVVLLGERDQPKTARASLSQRAHRLISEATTPDGWVTRTALYTGLGKPSRVDLDIALESLEGRGLIESRRIPPKSGRKTIEQWRARSTTQQHQEAAEKSDKR